MKRVDISVIEEPTAAAICKGYRNLSGNLIIIDVGAGTTDVVIGYMDQSGDELHFITTGRECDNALGGSDMDNRILQYLMDNDTEPPQLREIYQELPEKQKIRILAMVEEAKISTSVSGNAASSLVLPLGKGQNKRIKLSLDIQLLADIVHPLIWGDSDSPTTAFGIRPVIMKALEEAAGGNHEGISNVVKDIEHIVVVGGPGKMSCLHDMLKDVFKDNARIMSEVEALDPMDSFFMEGVAQGAAMSNTKNIEITTATPYTMSVFTLDKGANHVILENMPYVRGSGLKKTSSVPVTSGANNLFIISHNHRNPKEWSMSERVINVPKDGNLEITLVWEEAGTEPDKATVCGAGLPGAIKLPQMINCTTLGSHLEEKHKYFLSLFKQLPKLLEIKEPLTLHFARELGSHEDGVAAVEELLHIPPWQLSECEKLDIDTAGRLSPDDIQIALDNGFHSMNEQKIKRLPQISERAYEVLIKIFPYLVDNTTYGANELIDLSERMLAKSPQERHSSFQTQLSHWVDQLKASPNDQGIKAATATSLMALCDELYADGKIGDEDHSAARSLCFKIDSDE